jgi:hypothetical protein
LRPLDCQLIHLPSLSFFCRYTSLAGQSLNLSSTLSGLRVTVCKSSFVAEMESDIGGRCLSFSQLTGDDSEISHALIADAENASTSSVRAR